MEVYVFIPGQPFGKQRHRMTRAGRMYTPRETVEYERMVGVLARQAMGSSRPIEGPCYLYLRSVFGVPASWSKSKREDALAGRLVPTGKPDLSNILKAVEDGGNGILWVDDAQIVGGVHSKEYGTEPGVHVLVGSELDLCSAARHLRPTQPNTAG